MKNLQELQNQVNELSVRLETFIFQTNTRNVKPKLIDEDKLLEKTLEDNRSQCPDYLSKEILNQFKTHRSDQKSTEKALVLTVARYSNYPSEYVKECIILAAFG